MPGKFHYESNASPVTLPPIHSILGQNSSFDPIRSADSFKDPPPPSNGYHGLHSIYSSPSTQPNGSLTHARPSYPQYPTPAAPTYPSQGLPNLSAPYAPPRDSYRPAPSIIPSSQPPPTFGLPTIGAHPLKASPYASGPAPTHVRGLSDSLEGPDSRGPTRPVSHEQLRTDALSARPPLTARNVVDVREIPGEGECYVLEDGSIMRTEIAGEKVNPAWGITKAGKPRKRLAKACATCREKKIKCEQGGPGDTKCVQCARLNRPCKIPSDNHVPTGEETRPPKRPPPGNSLLNGRFGSQRLEASPIRQRYEMGTPHQTMNNYHTAFGRFEERHSVFTDDTLQGSSSDLQDSQLALGRKKGKQMRGRKFLQPHFPEHLTTDKFNNRTDPYEADAEATMYFLELFFHHRNSSPYVIWPRNRFFEWTRNCKTKSIDDLMILYALMALGTIFSQEPGTNEIGDKCYDIAYSLERERANQPSLQMMQARGALLLFNFARGNFEGTFEYTAHAIRTATSMRYTDENRVADIDETVTKYDFDMNAAQIKECRRRSFYITYFIDRYNSFSYGSMGQIHDIELFLRLPSHEDDYEEGREVETATFGGEDVRETHVVEPSPMALLVEITSIWGDVTGNSYRSVNRHHTIYVNYYEEYFRRTKDRMRAWVSSLPERLRYSRENISRAIQGNYFTDFYVLQAIFHLVGMKLGRTGRVDLLPDHIKRRNLRTARCYAIRFLRIVNALAQQIKQPPTDDIDLALSQPFPGYVILNACDVLSAGGKTSTLAHIMNNELEDSKSVLEQGGKFWTVNQKQCRAIDDRQVHLSTLSMNSKHETMRVRDAIDRSFLPENHDLVYRVDEKLFWEVIAERDVEEKDPLAS